MTLISTFDTNLSITHKNRKEKKDIKIINAPFIHTVCFQSPEVGGRITPEEDECFMRIHIDINPLRPCDQSFPKCLNNIELAIDMVAFLIVILAIHGHKQTCRFVE